MEPLKEIKSDKIEIAPNNPVVGYFNIRQQELYALKQHRILPYKKYKQEYRMTKLEQKREDVANYRMNTGFALVNAKASELLGAIPEFDFIAMDDDSKRFKKVRKLFWDWLWTNSKTDFAIYRIIYDALKYGSGWGLEEIVNEFRIVEDPVKTGVDGVYDFKKRTITDYEGCRLTHIPWASVMVNGLHTNNINEAVIYQEYDRDDFFQVYGNNPFYSNISEETIPKGKYYYTGNADDIVFYILPQNKDMQNYRKVTVAKYWNRAKDQYIVLANNVWINPKNGATTAQVMEDPWKWVMPIISPNKEIPLVCFTDHMVEDDVWGMGEYDITADSRSLKDTTRSLIIETIKAQAGIITIDPEADWDEATIQFGIRRFARVEKDQVGFFAPNINTSALQALEAKIDEDIIVESGVDFRSQVVSQSETATKTAGRLESSKKRINSGMKYNAYTFYEKLGRLRMSNMEFFYSDKTMKIPVNGQEEKEGATGVMQPLSGGYGIFTMRPEYFKGKFNIIPQIESLMSESSGQKKQKYLEFIQIAQNWLDPDTGKSMINPRKLAEAGRGIIDDVVDLDKLLESTPTQQSPDQILKQSGAEEMSPNAPQLDPGFVPPSQRSGAPVMMPSSPNNPGM